MNTNTSIILEQGSHPPQKPPTQDLVPIWKSLTKSNVKMSLKSKTNLFTAGEKIKNVYIVISGYLLLIKNGTILDILEPGQSLGAALLSQDKSHQIYPVTAQAIGSCDVLQIAADTANELIKSDYLVNAYFIQQFRERMEYMQSIRSILHLPVANRVAFFLIHKKKLLTEALITRKTMAQALNTTTETVIRTLTDFEKNKIIGYEGRKIILLNLNHLQNLCA